jgi:hypothetical protein
LVKINGFAVEEITDDATITILKWLIAVNEKGEVVTVFLFFSTGKKDI